MSVSITLATRGKSTFLIPDAQLGYFTKRCAKEGGLATYLSIMVRDYLPSLQLMKKQLRHYRDPNWNTVYQKQGLELHKKSFIPGSSDWEQLRHAAASCGVSMCFLFSFLMQLEADGFFQKIVKKVTVERNSFPQSSEKEGKLGKFSKFVRILLEDEQVLHRRLTIV